MTSQTYISSIKKLLKDKANEKDIATLLSLRYTIPNVEKPPLIFKIYNKGPQYDSSDLIYQIINRINKSKSKNEIKTIINWFKKNPSKNAKEFYFKLKEFNGMESYKTEKENDYFRPQQHFDIGIECGNPKCFSKIVELIDFGPTSGDEASVSLIRCPVCNWKRHI